MTSKARVIITGASGVLGTAVRNAFSSSNRFHILPLSFTQTGNGLTALDLLDEDQVKKAFKTFNPNWVIHCAAERRPDVANKNPEAARQLNAGVPAYLAALAKSINYTLVYISTDYVFDGTSPPYTPASCTNPVNLYGQTKLAGEEAVLSVEGAKAVVLRVPVLYGPAQKNSDSAVNILLDVVQDQSGKTYKVDHFATRYPTNILDIAKFLVKLTTYTGVIPPVLHYSATEPFTKYEMCLIFAKMLDLPHGHVISDAEPVGDDTTRPKNTHMDVSETENLGLEGGLDCCLFEEWWTSYLKN